MSRKNNKTITAIDMECPSGNVFEEEVIVNISHDTLILAGENVYAR